MSVNLEAEIFAYLTSQILLLAETPRDGQASKFCSFIVLS